MQTAFDISITKKKKSGFAAYFMWRLTQNKNAAIFSAISCGIMFPSFVIYLLTTMRDAHISRYTNDPLNVAAILATVVSAAVSMGLCFILPSLLTKYNRSKCTADMFFAIPVKENERFAADFLLGAAYINVPLITSGTASLILLAAGRYAICGGDCYFAEHNEFAAKTAPLLAEAVVVFAGAYATGWFFSVCCGRMEHAVISAGVFAVTVPVLVVTLISFAYKFLVGVSAFEVTAELIGGLPPFGTLCYSLPASNMSVDELGYRHIMFAVERPSLLAVNIIYIAALSLLSLYLTKRRRAEKAQQPYVYPLFYHVTSAAALTAAIALTLTLSENISSGITRAAVIIIGILISFVFYLTLETVHYRSIRKAGFTVIRFAVITALTFALTAVLPYTYGFGRAYIPYTSDVKTLTLKELPFADEEFYIEDHNGKPLHQKLEISMTDSGEITSAIAVNRLCAEKCETADSISGLTFTYDLNNGQQTKLRYAAYENEVTHEIFCLPQVNAKVKELAALLGGSMPECLKGYTSAALQSSVGVDIFSDAAYYTIESDKEEQERFMRLAIDEYTACGKGQTVGKVFMSVRLEAQDIYYGAYIAFNITDDMVKTLEAAKHLAA